MTDFASDRSALRSRGPSLPKLNLLPPSHFLQRHSHQAQSQHPLDTSDDIDLDMDMDMDFNTTAASSDNTRVETASRPFVSAHPSPEVSDDSDYDRERGLGISSTEADSQTPHSVRFDHSLDSHSTKREQGRRRVEEHLREQAQSDLSISQHLFLAPIPIPQSRTPPHSPLHSGKRTSFSMHTPPGSASSVMPVPCSDSAAVDALIREQVHGKPFSHSTDRAFFWHVGKLSDFSFSDRFVRSRVFEVTDTKSQASRPSGDNGDNHMVTNNAAVTSARDDSADQCKCTWRLRLYPHGRGDRHRDSEYVGLYLQQEAQGPVLNRRGSAIPSTVSAAATLSSSAPAPFTSRGSISSVSRRSISGGLSLPLVRRHVTLFIATEDGECLAKQDLVEWFSGTEGGLGFSRMVSRKTVEDAVRSSSVTDEEEEVREVGIVAGVIFHDL
ncbi:hypothetical protein BGX28_010358 [Mortierella sp. GBA30]|nr:hypothetical protein BGX28_010358 [Mortierella sp. GBA30]